MIIGHTWKIFLVIIVVLLTGCSSEPVPPPPLGFTVKADYKTNEGRLLYFVVRTTNEKQFMLDSYQDVASKAFSDPPAPEMLGVFSIVPGTQQIYTVNQPSQGSLALYFLFTQPGVQWKKLLAMPLEKKYSINLKEKAEVSIDVDKSWF